MTELGERRVITIGEAAKREQSKALWHIEKARTRSAPLVHQFMEPCFRCGTAGECRHRRAEHGQVG